MIANKSLRKPVTRKLNFSNHNWPTDLSSKQENMYYKNTLHSIESRPQRLQTVHKYSRTLISLLQQTTYQIAALASTLEKPELFTASTNARTAKISRIARITRISTIARITTIARRFYNRSNNLNTISRASYAIRLVRENSRFY